MEESYAALQANMTSVQNKVNQWSMGREKELQNIEVSHTAFLDEHNGGPLLPQSAIPSRLRHQIVIITCICIHGEVQHSCMLLVLIGMLLSL